MKCKHLVSFLLVAVCCSSHFSFAEGQPQTFEERHADKSYIFLLVENNIKVNADWSFTTRVHRKIKILKEDAKDIGEVPINYNRDFDRIMDQQVFTLTPDGKKHPPMKSQDMSVYDGEPMYSNAMVRILSMPAVGVGVIIDAAYTVSSRGLPMKDAFWLTEDVNYGIPVKEYRCSVTFPRKMGLSYREFGLTRKPEVTEKDGWVTYRWVRHDLYDHKQDEKYVPPPSPDDPLEAFEFSSVKNWDDFAIWYSRLIDKNTIMSPDIAAAARKAVGKAVLTRDKVRAVLEYIEDNFRYVSMDFGLNAFEPHPTRDVFANKYGDCKDLSLLTRAMLAVVGVKAHIALFNNENAINDPSYDLPIPTLFDHALLLVEDPLDGDFYADPLLKGYDIGQYPMEYQRAYTFIIANGKGRFGRLPEFDAERAADRTSEVVDIKDDWSGVVEMSRVWDLDASINARDSLRPMSDDEKKDMYQQLDFMMAQGGEVIKRQLEGVDQRYGRLRLKTLFRRPDEFPSADGFIIIDLEAINRDEAFEKTDRREGFFFSSNGIIEMEYVYRIPRGFEILNLPADLRLDGPHMSFERVFQRTPQGVKVKESLCTKRVALKKEALKDLRAYYATLAHQTRQRIVFKKK